MNKRGHFISFEGIDGCGKTSVISHVSLILRNAGINSINIREPGGTSISEDIRYMLLNDKNDMDSKTEALLYFAARSQVVKEIIKPALAQGNLVLADRFIDSTIAYQGYGRGLDINILKLLNKFATEGLVPDLTILLDLAPGHSYSSKKGLAPDRIEREGLTFQERVRNGYLELAKADPERIIIINAAQDFEKVVQIVTGIIKNKIELNKSL